MIEIMKERFRQTHPPSEAVTENLPPRDDPSVQAEEGESTVDTDPYTHTPQGYAEFTGPEWDEVGLIIEEDSYQKAMADMDALSYDLPSQRRVRRYTTLFEDAAEKTPGAAREKAPLSEAQKHELIALMANTGLHAESWLLKDGRDLATEHLAQDETTVLHVLSSALASEDLAAQTGYFNAICRSMRELDPEQGERVVSMVEEHVAHHIHTNGVSITLLDFLGRLREVPHGLVNPELVKAIERKGSNSASRLDDQLAVLMRLGHEDADLATHHTLSYLREHLYMLQNGVEEDMDADIFREHQNAWEARGANPDEEWEVLAEAERAGVDFSLELVRDLKAQGRYCPNYLVRLHLEDYVEMLDLMHTPKPDAISGTPGGASDTTIYTYRHILDAYRNRLALGMLQSGYPARNPVFKVADGYLAEYDGGRIARVFPEGESGQEQVQAIEQACIVKNDTRYEYIYENLSGIYADQPYRDDSYKLDALRDLWDLDEQLQADRASFFFDLSCVPLAELHPAVVVELVTRNQQYLIQHAQTIETLRSVREREPLAHHEYLQRLNPVRETSPREEYLYGFMGELGIRKKVERDFGIDLGDLSLWVQRTFMDTLMRSDLGQARYLKDYVRSLGMCGVKALVAGECNSGNDVFDIYEQCTPHERAAILSWYGGVVDGCSTVRDYLQKEFGAAPSEQATYVQETTRMLLSRASGVLHDIARGASQAKDRGRFMHEQIARLERADLETSLYGVALKVLHEHHPDLAAESLPGLECSVCGGSEIPPKDIEHMRTIYQENYARRGERFRAALMEGFDQKLKEARFYIVRVKGTVVAFDAFTDKGDTAVYFGAFNTAPHLHGLLMGGVVLDRSLEREGRGKAVLGDCFPDEGISQKYLNELGFQGVGTTVLGEETLLHIVRTPEGEHGPWAGIDLDAARAGALPESLYLHTIPMERPFVFDPEEESDTLVRLFRDGGNRYVVYARNTGAGEKQAA